MCGDFNDIENIFRADILKQKVYMYDHINNDFCLTEENTDILLTDG